MNREIKLSKRLQRCNPSAFTLVELLVVIGIIALLISILLPSLAKARESANGVKCLASLRQMANMNNLYLQDNKGWYLPRTYGYTVPTPSLANPNPIINGNYLPGVTPVPQRYWDHMHAWRQYLGMKDYGNDTSANTQYAPKSFLCPNAVLAFDRSNANAFGERLIYLTYGYNAMLGNNSTDPHLFFGGYKAGRIRESAAKIMFADATDRQIQPCQSHYYLKEKERNASTGGHGQAIAYRHNNAVNIVFWDGHAERRSQESIMIDNPSNTTSYTTALTSQPNFHQWDVTNKYGN